MRNLSGLKVCLLAGTLTPRGAERQLFYILQALCQTGATPGDRFGTVVAISGTGVVFGASG